MAAVATLHLDNPFSKLLRMDSKTDFDQIARHLVGFRQDAGLTAAFARQLEHVFAKTYEVEFAEYRAHEFFPTNTEVDAGDLTFTYRMIERIGNAQIINAGNARDLTNVDVGGEEWQQPVVTLGASYNFSVIDQNSGRKANFAIEAEKAKAARGAIEALEEQIYALGAASAGVCGVTNAPGVAAVTKTSTGTWISQLLTAQALGPLSAAAVSTIAGDLLAMKQQVFSQTIGRHKVTNILLPPNLFAALDSVPQSPLFNNQTFLGWLESTLNVDIDYWPILLNAGATLGSPTFYAAVSGSNPQQYTRILAYEKNPDVIQLIQAQSFTQLAPQATGLVWEIPVFSRIGGAMAVRPLGIVYLDGC